MEVSFTLDKSNDSNNCALTSSLPTITVDKAPDLLDVPSSLPNLHTMGHNLSPIDKINKRIRTLSEQSSASDVSSDEKSSQPSIRSKQKLISKSGIYSLDSAKKCKFYHVSDYLDVQRSSSVLMDVSGLIVKEKDIDLKKLSVEFERDDNWMKSKSNVSDELEGMITFHTNQAQKAINNYFQSDILFNRVVLRRLANGNDKVAYQSFSSNNDNAAVAILTVGSPRVLSLRLCSGRKVTHQSPLLPGTLSVMTGKTQQLFEHSIIKESNGANCGDTFCIFMIGSSPESSLESNEDPSSEDEAQDEVAVDSEVESKNESESESTSDKVTPNEVLNFSILPVTSAVDVNISGDGNNDAKLPDIKKN